MKKPLFALLGLFLLAGAAGAVDLPPPAGFVTDTVNLLAPAQKQQLEAELKRYEAQTGTEIAVLIVADTGGMPAPDYATEIANRWGIGKKGADNGALVLVAVNSHDFWIAVGRQLEGALTDSQSGAIFRNVVRPRFREGDYAGGLMDGVQAMERAIAGESFTDTRMDNGGGNRRNGFKLYETILFFAVIALSWLAAILGRSKAIWPGGLLGAAAGGVVSWFFAYSLATVLIIAAGAGLFGLGFDWVVSRNYDRYRGGGPMPPWWMGGGGFGGSSGRGFGGFGGGGFSGGGGGGRW